ncbi:hypothetical protein B2D45_09045 [Lactobacillus hilgardii]|uniref:MazG nucleotide pyrophosphohydrolase domain protein n=2 Tax=Lentilactobacillus hilgardii TaxID=1588 RepID=C0XJ80_LENH9|nr:MazG nucleotide pyrophosphohydrolase domain protein [Lentilactobacillus buchneri ATCC 11577]EEI24554.1 MazG nucleotide pyrophosphohydrolase domain protein [Lentilactobacillus hilgardii DSM 20176 = ATCC 8290]MCT3394996.1 hypothetical protein [Lentilactobacillus hilgardii]QEU37661.1 hypothetical protein LH500_01135 [Lentilactobacillus hilgardii]
MEMDYLKLSDHTNWLIDFYEQRNWYQYSPFIRLNFLTEEVGELSRAIRAIEIGRDHPGEKVKSKPELRDNLVEELADTMDQVLILCGKFDVDPEKLMAASEKKLRSRFQKD